jgi:1-acyl-sn-glycerol-3-phosphate acyltransferase
MFYKIAVVVLKVLVFLIFDLEAHNYESFNKSQGKCIICANHISMLDPVMLAISTKRKICYMGKKELFENKFLGYIFSKLGAFPVDRAGVSLSAIKASLSVLNRDEVLGIFPEGTRVKEYNDKNAKPGIAMIANKANSKIIPVYITGNYKFRGKINIYFGQEKNYVENYAGKISTEKYTEIGKEILKDIYDLGKDR